MQKGVWSDTPGCSTLKINWIGITGPIYDVLSDNLLNRTQRVVVDGHFSSETPVTSDISQHSVLIRCCSSLLWTIWPKTLGMRFTSLPMTSCSTILSGTHGLHGWTRWTYILFLDGVWTLDWRWNPTKSQHLWISFKQKNKTAIPSYVYKCAGTKIPSVDSAKYLGVTLNSQMSWKPHVDDITRKSQQRMRGIPHLFPRRCSVVKQMQFKGLVLPVLEYCSPV